MNGPAESEREFWIDASVFEATRIIGRVGIGRRKESSRDDRKVARGSSGKRDEGASTSPKRAIAGKTSIGIAQRAGGATDGWTQQARFPIERIFFVILFVILFVIFFVIFFVILFVTKFMILFSCDVRPLRLRNIGRGMIWI